MPTRISHNRTFDARPDRIDYRDRTYQPPLVSLPRQSPSLDFIDTNLSMYTKSGMILNQGNEGACTGFGLSAVINYLLWRKDPQRTSHFQVSERMLYHMAKIYDEWQGEDYEGSSCRGAMKGWHRHGVCTNTLWPYRDKRHHIRFLKPKSGWQSDAARKPLGAYYRINKDSIADMQAAIHEVGAIYVSASVHEGWNDPGADNQPKKRKKRKKKGNTFEIPLIDFPSKESGGHAFCLVGYNTDGFIVQNSWGHDWGALGFAVMTYEDWSQNGSDAWVAVLGAPMRIDTASRTTSSISLRRVADGQATWFWRVDNTKKDFDYKDNKAKPISEDKAYEYTVVLGNNGEPLNRFLDVQNAADAVKEVVFTNPNAWLATKPEPKLAIYFHGGLNDEDDSVKRIRVMAPYFLGNDIYPMFITWRTGLWESITGILEDSLKRIFLPYGAEPAQSPREFLEKMQQRLKDAKDRTFELACKNLGIKSIWMEMKQNAKASTNPKTSTDSRAGGLYLIGRHLAALKRKHPKLEVHLVGHSAGSILIGHLLDKLVSLKLKVSTCQLYAPACTVEFAVDHYKKAVDKKILLRKNLHVDLMDDDQERADSVGPYGKSLLYLVSRALEDVHKMPLMGMAQAWEVKDKKKNDEMWYGNKHDDLLAWSRFAGSQIKPEKYTKDDDPVWDGEEFIPLAHGSFDNDIYVITKTLKCIRDHGRPRGHKLKIEVENLHGF